MSDNPGEKADRPTHFEKVRITEVHEVEAELDADGILVDVKAAMAARDVFAFRSLEIARVEFEQ